MSTGLLDVNVLVALAWPNHVHHEVAHRWFRAHSGRGWATCSTTQSGFVRVSSNPRANRTAKTPLEALALLRRMTELEGHRFLADDVDLARLDWLRMLPLVGHRQVTDAHLVALAHRHAVRLVTLDRALASLVPPELEPELRIELLA